MTEDRTPGPAALDTGYSFDHRDWASLVLFSRPPLVAEKPAFFRGETGDSLGGNLVQHTIDLALSGVIVITPGRRLFSMPRDFRGRMHEDPRLAAFFTGTATTVLQQRL